MCFVPYLFVLTEFQITINFVKDYNKFMDIVLSEYVWNDNLLCTQLIVLILLCLFKLAIRFLKAVLLFFEMCNIDS